MRGPSLSFLVLVMLLGSKEPLIAQTLDVQKKIETDLALKRLQGVWVPELLLTTAGAEAYPLTGRALCFEGGTFVRIEGKRTVASGSFKVEQGYLRLTVKEHSPWDLEAANLKGTVQYTFKVEGDLLTLCYSLDNKGKAGDLTPGKGRQVVLYKRQRMDSRVQRDRAQARDPATRVPGPGSRTMFRDLLNQTIDVKNVPEVMTFKEAIGLVRDRVANYHPDAQCLVDEQALPAFHDTAVRFPSPARNMTIENALQHILKQLPEHNGTFIWRAGKLEITSSEAASPKQLLRQRVLASFKNWPLEDALEELSERSGLSIIVDARVGDKMKAPVTASLGNDLELEKALRLLTDMVGLRLVVNGDGVYVTSPANAQRLEGLTLLR